MGRRKANGNGSNHDDAALAAESALHTEHDGADQECKTIQRELPCQLADADLIAKARRAATLGVEIEDLKVLMKPLRAQVKEKADERAKLEPQIKTCTEPRLVECKVEKIWSQNLIVVTRMDTLEVVENRAMTAGERQGELWDGDHTKLAGAHQDGAQGDAELEGDASYGEDEGAGAQA